jgi:hypothetical protein
VSAINYIKTVEGVGEVKNTDIVKGYEVDKDQYVTLDPEEFEALKLESSKTIELAKFVDASDIDPRYFERPYYLGPGDQHSGEQYQFSRPSEPVPYAARCLRAAPRRYGSWRCWRGFAREGVRQAWHVALAYRDALRVESGGS